MRCTGETNHADRDNHPAVLVVEDERISRCALTSLLHASGYQPQPCKSAEEALECVDSGSQAEFALIDLDLPGMSGLDLIEQLEELRPALTAIIMTAADADRVEGFRKQHHVHYLRKPLDFPRVLGLLRSDNGSEPLPC
jgi:DNA-binding NtrC family response regulator